ncbi:hypothetical protein Pcinc_002944 [Petrolisthes cinctipes]|uniref:RNase H type-1 domain-containing protein n=1 Tax=Petrolisthes cinctipes TaxID=88211 RepID=A0AAE1L538_PETCI|nr:hypothetical protein Pcinc_002944 [Petrolisthes cinctipes]
MAQADGVAGSPVFSPDLELPPGSLVGRRLCNHSSSTWCELYAILDAVSLVCQVNAAIFCDSKPALHSLSSVQPIHSTVVQLILSFLALLRHRNFTVKMLSVPSHVGLRHNGTVDRLAKEACHLPPRGVGRPLSLTCYLSRIRSAALLPVWRRMDAERPFSISITLYEFVCHHKYIYHRRGLMVRRHNVVSARLRLGYQPLWQVAGMQGEPPFTECHLCQVPRANTIEH